MAKNKKTKVTGKSTNGDKKDDTKSESNTDVVTHGVTTTPMDTTTTQVVEQAETSTQATEQDTNQLDKNITDTNTSNNDTKESTEPIKETATQKRKHSKSQEKPKKKEKDPNKPAPMFGKPVSGRSWKGRELKKASAMHMDARNSYQRSKEESKKLKALREYDAAVKARRGQEAEQRRKSIEASKKRKAEQVLKSTTLHVIKNPHKIKKMSRKRQKLFSKINVNELQFTKVLN